MRRDFIKNNFSVNILDTYNKLKPGAYKADLWRLCILYIFGGIYLDIKYSCVGNFKLISLTNKNYFVSDRNVNNEYGIYNALICSVPNNPLLLDCINKIVENVKNNFYGTNPLEVTGPLCLNKFFTQEDIKNLELSFDGNFILHNKTPILKMYKEYRVEQKKFGNAHYDYLWTKKNIYNI
jgi:mannosyltransferase OCH1-like enzyme